NPLGIDGQNVAVEFAGFAGVQAVPGDGGGTFTFADLDVTLPINPGALMNTVAIKSARLSGPNGPSTITLTVPELTVRIWQGAEAFEDAVASARAEASLSSTSPIVLEKGSCFPVETGPCNYTYQSGPTTLGNLTLSGSPLSTMLSIVTTAPSP